MALALAAVGLFGLIRYNVAQRTHEIGIRMALGATPATVLRMVLAEGLRLALTGTTAGMVAALVFTHLLGSLLYGVSPIDPATYVGVGLALIFVALLACWLPARSAARVDPMVALRYE
jgi:putative ABC transport system permease protein